MTPEMLASLGVETADSQAQLLAQQAGEADPAEGVGVIDEDLLVRVRGEAGGADATDGSGDGGGAPEPQLPTSSQTMPIQQPTVVPSKAAPATPPVSSNYPAPTREEMMEFDGFGNILLLAARWAGLREQTSKAIFDALGFNEADHMKVLAIDSDQVDDMMAELCDLQVNGRPLGFGDKAKLKNMVHCCRKVCGLSELRSKSQAPVTNIYQAPPNITPDSAAEAKKDPEDKPLKFKMDMVAVQGDETEVSIMSDEDYFAARLVYRKKEGNDPPHDQEVNQMQMTAFRIIIRAGGFYLDFAIWLPYGDRNQARRKFNGLIQAPNGKYIYVEMYGPGSFREWSASWKLKRVACLSLQVCSPARLDAYHAMIEDAAIRYPDAWALIYQADVRTRREHFKRVKYELSVKYMKYKKNGWDTEDLYDPKQPWEHVLRQITEGETVWWQKQLETPCWRFTSGMTPMAAFIGGDALTSSTTGSVSGGAVNPYPGTQRTEVVPMRPKRYREEDVATPRGGRPPAASAPPVPSPPSGADPRNTILSRKGKSVCAGFQDGSCAHLNSQGYCAVDGVSLHICSICKRAGHNAETCWSNPANKRQPGAGPSSSTTPTVTPWQKNRPRRGRGGKGRGRGIVNGTGL